MTVIKSPPSAPEPAAAPTFARQLARVVAGHGAQAGVPLGAEQRRLWLLHTMAAGLHPVVLSRYRITGSVTPAEVQVRLADAVLACEALRSVVVPIADRAVRLVLPVSDVALRVVDLGATAGADDVLPLVRQVGETRFALDRGPLLRALLVLCGPDRAEFVLAGHRMIVDETSLDLLAAAVLGDPSGPVGGDLTGVLREETGRAREPDAIAALDAWGRDLAGPAATQLTGSRPRPPVKAHHVASTTLTLPDQLALRAGALADWPARAGASWLAVLMRHAATTVAACGVWAPRPGGQATVVGPLDRLRPLRCDVTEDGRLAALVGATDAALRHPPVDLPLAHLLEVRPPQRDVSRTPYVQTVLRTVDARTPVTQGPGRVTHREPVGVGWTEYDLALTVWLEPHRLSVQVDYDAAIYDEATVRALVARFGVVLDSALDDATAQADIGLLPLLDTDPAEILARSRGHRTDEPPGSLVDLVSAQVGRRPRAPAVRHGEIEVSYAELWDRAGRIAGALHDRGVGPGHRVAVWLRRGPDAIATLLGVLLSGAAYVPVDPAYPRERVRRLLTDSGSTLVVTESTLGLPDAPRTTVLRLDDLPVPGATGWTPVATVPPDAPAYLIYTSGSTGRPKGVAIAHSSVVNNVRWRQRLWSLTESDRVLHNHSFSFDPSVWAVFWPLSAGACVVLAGESELDDPDRLVRLVRDTGVSVVGGVPSLLGLMLDSPAAGECTRVRLVLSGGEPLPPSLVEQITTRWSAELANLYGPTEATIDATAYRLPAPGIARPGPNGAPPIGRPVDNTEVYLVDADLRPVPDGVPGELLVGGRGLAIGYHDRPALTAERFLPDPFGTEPGGRLYRTGDFARRSPAGEIEYLRRVDDQVKVRGFRIEPREVEIALAGCQGVREAAVVVLDRGTAAARLAAAVVTVGGPVDPARIRAEVAVDLPGHLVPDLIRVLPALPRLPNGKLDRVGLTTRLAAAPTPTESAPAEPRTDLERQVGESFAQVLGTPRVGGHTDFFAHGGTSMMLARLAAALRARHEVDIPLHEFFQTPTVAGVAATIELYRREGLAGVLSRQHAATLEADGTLDDSIRPDGLPHADWFAPKRVLLTGATGYLGLHLVAELLNRTSADVICLCRGESPAHAMDRIRAGLADYEIDVADQLHRVRCVIGDLGHDRLGVTGADWDELASTVDVIYHNGALVNFVYPYSALKAPNVGGTQQVLRLACTNRLKAVHHISTIDTLLATHTPRPFLEDDAPLRSAVGVPAGYTGSKWVAEKVVDVARQRNIPVTVFRPGLILGHTRTGATQTIDYLLVALRGFLPMRIIPEYPRIFDAVPVDYVAAGVVHGSLQPGCLNGFYHLFNPAPVSLRQFCDWIASYGYEFDVVPFEQARRRALRVGPGHPLYPLVPLIRDAEPEPHRALDPRHMDEIDPARECARALRLFAGSDVRCPPTDEASAHAVLDYLVRVGFLPSPDELKGAS